MCVYMSVDLVFLHSPSGIVGLRLLCHLHRPHRGAHPPVR